jgi:hypothetical protein
MVAWLSMIDRVASNSHCLSPQEETEQPDSKPPPSFVSLSSFAMLSPEKLVKSFTCLVLLISAMVAALQTEKLIKIHE